MGERELVVIAIACLLAACVLAGAVVVYQEEIAPRRGERRRLRAQSERIREYSAPHHHVSWGRRLITSVIDRLHNKESG
jgi:hypothetical protein